MSKVVLILFVFMIPFLGNTQDLKGDQGELIKILKNIKEFSAAVMASDYETIGQAYTADAKIFPSNREIIEGRDAIVKYWTPTNGSRISYHQFMPKEINITGEQAYDYEYYKGKTINAGGKEISWQGKYVVIWKKIDNQWKIYLDIWNRVPNDQKID
ncbi:YybH family protein [Aureitalea marina]|uniref:DUF4440 domain-containing protein n=1 Tax=Aureitalea marina TaxID=930804 RepID=A0A2S7KSU9_9FLAO|nr:DUF4440 domain-containing protein [Aureitalea marina]PQB05702.1 DUF4440 domain-containing protein [Aureitalea marina]